VAKANEWIYQSIGFSANEPLSQAVAKMITLAQERNSPVVLMLPEVLVADPALFEPLANIPSKGLSIVVLSAKSSAALLGNFPPNLTKRVRFADCAHLEDTLATEVSKIRDMILEEPTSDNSSPVPVF
jgi:hypothetical protein